MRFPIEQIKFDERGLVPVVVWFQHAAGLTLAWMNAEESERTVETKRPGSRARGQAWHKGETSGHTQRGDILSIATATR
jgi:phosphoribosyl-ATP pyrophosphohydrolase/phosphoribosyl-AMP cyclohydrolase